MAARRPRQWLDHSIIVEHEESPIHHKNPERQIKRVVEFIEHIRKSNPDTSKYTFQPVHARESKKERHRKGKANERVVMRMLENEYDMKMIITKF